ncbi:hypothetical protein [Hyphomicrobium sp. DY-1]|uniref:hypothetical protein n=1 Tax=Hyphomicrobium sp. DY-1 TaxID=3075650 RepID=UPI0039C18493
MSRADRIDMPLGEIVCEECRGDPRQYRIDFDVDCPNCRNVGTVPDPDYYDASEAFDPRAEYGTHHHIYCGGRR